MARVIEVASLIHNEPQKWTRSRLAERFEVNITTIQRDVDLLREMSIQIVPRGKRGYEMISDFFLPDLNLDFKEALALITAANFYRAAEGKQAGEVMNRAIHKITSALPNQARNFLNQIAPQIEGPHHQMSEIDDGHPYKEDLYRAIRERRSVRITYNSFSSGQKTHHRLAPYAVLFRKPAWYVIGHSETSDQIRTFRINRIDSLKITQLGYTIPEHFSVQKHLEKSWDIMLGPETHVVILFGPRIAPLIREVNWHPTQQIQELKDGVLHFEVTVAGWREIGWWVLSWGDEATVVKPKALQKWVVQTVRKMVELYTNETPNKKAEPTSTTEGGLSPAQ
ncbi:MAG: transcriptional regulator [Gammaproteobacteria bacterium]|nr:transcriptional regulator [Gammaproteobacteria bacterium]